MISRCTRRVLLRRLVASLLVLLPSRRLALSDKESAPLPPALPQEAAVAAPSPAGLQSLLGPCPRVKVVGVGGAGGTIVARLLEKGIPGAEFCVADTNVRSEMYLEGQRGILLGPNLTRGLATGGCLERGAQAAAESAGELRAALAGADLALIVAGLGGGTGGGAGPVVTQLAREAGATTVALVTLPFAFEGRRRAAKAAEGLDALSATADTVIVVTYEALSSALRSHTLAKAFRALDDLVAGSARGLVEPLTIPGLICVHFDDFRRLLSRGGMARLGVAQAEGLQSGQRAVWDAVASPLCSGAPFVRPRASSSACVRGSTWMYGMLPRPARLSPRPPLPTPR